MQKLHFSALHTSILSAENSSGSRNPKHEKEMENEMATSNSNNLVNPNAREAMNRFKMEAAAEMGVNLSKTQKSRAAEFRGPVSCLHHFPG